MAGTATPIFPQTVKCYAAQILNSDASNVKTLVTGATNGTKIESISVATTDGTTRDVVLVMTISSVVYQLATINIPANAGNTNAIPAVDLLRHVQWPGLAYDANGNKILYVASGAVLGVKSTSTVTSAKEIDFLATGGDF
ncbi:hypothetical protein [Burkholderia seminalis]|uniref:hypothetical protein n=1 Tax=Burkholderia seminalis TaxID=488731 RepID=UPI000F59593A|nr:hypothetical protein [Burkholderia seminalis]RQS84325.1 hypothetical protein DF032_04480 [Burkholderia seminalis]